MLPVRHIVRIALVAALLTALQPQPADAAFGITSTSGAVQLLGPPPPNVHAGSVEGALPIIFHEVLSGEVMNLAGLPVDHDGSNVVAAPTISGNVVNPALVDTTIGTGIEFNSYLFHFDPVGSPFFAFYVSTITFDNPIIGVQLFSSAFDLDKPSGTNYIGTLEAGDSEIGANGGPPLVYYPGGVNYRGVEEDSFVIAIAGSQLQIAGSSQGIEIDQIRILTAPSTSTVVPEPATALTWALIAVIGGCAYAWRRQNGSESVAG